MGEESPAAVRDAGVVRRVVAGPLQGIDRRGVVRSVPFSD